MLDVSHPIQSFQGSLPKGQYTVPFDIATSGLLPPSFKHEDYPLRAEIYYYIKAVIDDKAKTKAIKNIIWASSHPPRGAVDRSLSNYAAFDVSDCCCFNAGLTTITASVSRDFGHLGDQFEVTVQVNNNQGLKTANWIRLNLARVIDIQGQENFGFLGKERILHPFRLKLNLQEIQEL